MRHKFKNTPFLGCIFQWVSTFVVSTWETPQAFTEPLQDPAPSFSNTDFPKCGLISTKMWTKMQDFGQYARNFDQNPQMNEIWANMLIWWIAAIHESRAVRKLNTHLCSPWKYYLGSKLSKKWNFQKFWTLIEGYTSGTKNVLFSRITCCHVCFLRTMQRSRVRSGAPVATGNTSWTH